jgi:hypothetical protein
MGVLSRAAAVAGLDVVIAGAARLNATSYPPVTFDELVIRADVIFVGEVVDVRPYTLSTRDGEIIKTRVVFRVADPLWGTTSTLEVFDFLGGEIGEVAMRVSEMPRFAIGERRVIFARRDRSINPIVGFTQGVLRVDRDVAGIDRVFTLDGAALAGPETIGAASTAPRPPRAASMRLTDLRSRVTTAIAGVKK